MNSKCDGGEMSCDSQWSNEINKRTGAVKRQNDVVWRCRRDWRASAESVFRGLYFRNITREICLHLPVPPSLCFSPSISWPYSSTQKRSSEMHLRPAITITKRAEVQEKEIAVLMVNYVELNEELPHDWRELYKHGLWMGLCVFTHTYANISFCSLKVVFGITVWLCRQNLS